MKREIVLSVIIQFDPEDPDGLKELYDVPGLVAVNILTVREPFIKPREVVVNLQKYVLADALTLAAPELLKALKFALDSLGDPVDTNRRLAAVIQGNNAIAKAEGKS
jgi:hypothetical protein